MLAGSIEGGQRRRPPSRASPRHARAPGGDSALARYATDLTERARAGKIDPVVGRDPEIRQIVDILMRRRQNNPILTGEAGVGKTAVVEGFALRIAQGDVPPMLQGVSLRMLDVGLMQAGASVKGEFEKRLRAVIDEVQSSEVPIILFIDEAHTLIGAGGAAGTGDAANLLKPALARGELRTVAATTWAEYKQHIEKDPALTRRFQVVKIEEPDEAAAVQMLRGVAGVLEKHHEVQILDEAIEAAVAPLAPLHPRPPAARQGGQPARHRLRPRRRLAARHARPRSRTCAAAGRCSRSSRASSTARRRSASTSRRGGAQARGGAGRDRRRARRRRGALGARARAGRAGARPARPPARRGRAARRRRRGRPSRRPSRARRAGDVPRPGAAAARRPTARPTSPSCARLMAELGEAQGETPLILPSVDRNAVAAVVQDWTGIPTGRMLTSQTEKALKLAAILAERVVGQDHAMEMIAKRVQTSRAGLGAPEKPVGVFLLCGPSGVGKTETALALAETLYGGEQNLITINMSEFQEAHTVSLLKGAPPGYVGYGKGGVLTEAVRRKPYSVILLDEVEKAHPDVHEIFFQVFDKGMMDDSEGRRIDFKNALILLTSNVGSEVIMAKTDNGRTARGDRRPRRSAARAAPQGLPGGLPRPGGDDPLLSAQRRR